MDICIKCDEESKDGDPLNYFVVRLKYGGGKNSCVPTYHAVL